MLGSFADIPRTRNALSSRRFDPGGCFLAEDNHTPIGWVAVTRLPHDKWFVIRYLSVRRKGPRVDVAEKLLERAIGHVESENPDFVRATTPAIQPYVDTYKKYGFKPLRRDFRISWQLDDLTIDEDLGLDTEEVSEKTLSVAQDLFVRALSPLWDWRTEEEGGIDCVARSFLEDRARGTRWILASLGREPVGLVGIHPDVYEKGVAWFHGAFVPPEHRGKRIGLALMSRISQFAKRLEQRKIVVYTFSFLDSLAPGALLYLRSGGKIDAEHLQLART